MKVELGDVQETLLIPLYYRYKDAQPDKPILDDPYALEIGNKLDYDFAKFKSDKLSYYGCLARGKKIDSLAREEIKKTPDLQIISVGVGLDSMFYRIDNGSISWYNLDFPDVIDLRERLFPANSRVKNIGKSCLDPSWLDEIDQVDRPTLIISEGVSMYLTEEENLYFFKIICDKFDDLTLIYDTVPAMVAKAGGKSLAVSKTRASYHWGTEDESTIPSLEPRLRPIAYINNTDEMQKHLKGLILLILPLIRMGNNRIAVLGKDQG